MKTKKIVLTGGPCAGKTTISEVLSRTFPDQVIVLPESASLLIRGGFPRWEQSRGPLQSAIYQVQTQLEFAYEQRYSQGLLIMDRGTVDGAAYWPQGPDDFFRTMKTTQTQELGRYHRVIYLESAEECDYETYRLKNPIRSETWSQAKALDDTTRAIWSQHSRFTIVKNNKVYSEKVSEVLKLIADELRI